MLADIAEETGLAGEEIRTAVEEEQLRDSIRDEFSEAQQAGVSGVPAFVYMETVLGVKFRLHS